jgi:hypothetical protein
MYTIQFIVLIKIVESTIPKPVYGFFIFPFNIITLYSEETASVV